MINGLYIKGDLKYYVWDFVSYSGKPSSLIPYRPKFLTGNVHKDRMVLIIF